MSKKCFSCKRKYPLWLFSKNPPGSYARESEQGVSINCNICNYKVSLRNGCVFHSYRDSNGKRKYANFYMGRLQTFLFTFFYSNKRKQEILTIIINEEWN